MNGVPHKRADVVASIKGFIASVPDFAWTIQDLLVADGRIAARLQGTGTPVRAFLGHEATGASINIMEYAFHRVRDGRFVEMWFLMDAATVAGQLREGERPVRR